MTLICVIHAVAAWKKSKGQICTSALPKSKQNNKKIAVPTKPHTSDNQSN